MASGWAWLPDVLLDSILEKLGSRSEYARFSVVCIPWRRFALETNGVWRTKLQSLPMLMISKDDDADECKRSLYSLAHQKVLDFQLPVPYKKQLTSSQGWLVTVEDDYSVTLYNPFSMMVHGNNNDNIIHLPQLRAPALDLDIPDSIPFTENWPPDPCHRVLKAVISEDPISASNDYSVMVLYGEYMELAFIKPSRDKTWTYFDGGLSDIIWYKGKIYSVDDPGTTVTSYDVDSLQVNVDHFNIPRTPDVSTNSYLVESCMKELLMVHRFVIYHDVPDDDDDFQRVTTEFRVFKLNPSGPGPNFIRMESLGDEAVFLGCNSSLSVLASNFTGCRTNSIFFTEDYTAFPTPFRCGPTDLGVFNMENGRVAPHYKPHDFVETFKKMIVRPPIWFVPTFNSKDLPIG